LIAFDTNILVYAASASDNSGRHSKALDLLQRLGISGAIVALPVVGELFNVRRKKKFVDVITLIAKVEIWTAAFDCPMPQLEDYLTAAEISERCNLQFFDSLIIAVSARGGATILLSEDMQDGLQVDGLRIVNPFAAANQALLADYFGSAG
jgi:predicted nucleic acid-binding protein